MGTRRLDPAVGCQAMAARPLSRSGSGDRFAAGRRLAVGGEGEIYEVSRHPGLVFKRLHDAVLANSPDAGLRLEAMVANRPTRWQEQKTGHILLAWPSDVVLESGRFVGYVMPRIDVRKTAELHVVTNPSDRRNPGPNSPAWVRGFNWRYLLQTATNLALATRALHVDGYVIGDFNERNVLISHDARVTLVDCDSMQVRHPSGRVFPCVVGRPEFTAPELLGTDLRTTPRRPSSDLFALAVHIHQLLMDGAHPFDGLWHGDGDKPKRHQLAKEGVYAYAGDHRLTPHPGAIPFDFLPSSIRQLFIAAFVDGATRPDARPTGRRWRVALDEVVGEVRRCQLSRDHWYPAHHSSCPWCARTTAAPRHRAQTAHATRRPVTTSPSPNGGAPSATHRSGPFSRAAASILALAGSLRRRAVATAADRPGWVLHSFVCCAIVAMPFMVSWRELGIGERAGMSEISSHVWRAVSGADSPTDVMPDCPDGTTRGWQGIPALLLALVDALLLLVAIVALRAGVVLALLGLLYGSAGYLVTRRYDTEAVSMGGGTLMYGVGALLLAGLVMRTAQWLAGYCY